jgi:3',5'-cyclic AMP phosphodiesterase CpdA
MGIHRTHGVRPLGRFLTPRCRSTTRIAILADVHVTPVATGTWKCFGRTERRLETAVEDVNARTVDAVAITGDLTADGRPAEFDRVAELLEGFDPPVFAVPGNHDVPKAHDDHSTPPLPEFVSRFSPGLPFHERVGGVDLIGLNTASTPDGSLADTHHGGIDDAQQRWLERTLSAADAPVVLTHHPLGRGTDHAWVGMAGDDYRLEGADGLADLLAEGGVGLSVSGHVHWPTAAPLPAGYEIVAPALCSFPCAYLLIGVTPRGTTVEMVPAADREAVREARDRARTTDRGARLVATADDGYFERFPLIDARPVVR